MTRRRVTAGAIGLAAVLGLGLGACGTDNTPQEYGTLTQQNFLEGCTNYYFDLTDDTLAITGNTVAADVTAPDQSACQCMYEAFSGPDGLPINSDAAPEGYDGLTFTDFNNDVKDNQQQAWDQLPQGIKDEIGTCASDGGSSSSGSTSTTASDGTTTTTAEG